MSLTPLYDAGWLIAAHAFVAIAAFALGLAQLMSPKGTRPHRTMGWIWVSLMAFVAISSFGIYTLWLVGPFSPIHLISIYTIVSLVIAVRQARRGDVDAHRKTMLWMFFTALVIAGAFTFMPGRIMYKVVTGG